jgi:hypothetical protein
MSYACIDYPLNTERERESGWESSERETENRKTAGFEGTQTVSACPSGKGDLLVKKVKC